MRGKGGKIMEKSKVYYCDMHATGRMNLLEKLKFFNEESWI